MEEGWRARPLDKNQRDFVGGGIAFSVNEKFPISPFESVDWLFKMSLYTQKRSFNASIFLVWYSCGLGYSFYIAFSKGN